MDPQMMGQLREGLILYLILAGSIALHEFGHAKAADMLGDPLPRSQGRVTLNPLAHLDPIGTVLIPLAMIFLPILSGHPLGISIIGWGRPVQISLPNPRTRKRDEIITTIAGPAMNALIALCAAIFGGLILRFHGSYVADLSRIIIYVNCLLIAFNCIPLPPLDGSRILRHLIGMSEEAFIRMTTITPFILLILVNTHAFQVWLGRAVEWVQTPFVYCLYRIGGG